MAYNAYEKAVPLHREIKREKMENFLILALLAGGAYFLKYRNDRDKEWDDREKDFQKSNKDYLDIIDELEDIINPNNDNAKRLPVEISADMKLGGGWLNQIEITLHFKNVSQIPIELSDFRTMLVIGGYESLTVKPANTSTITIPPGRTFDFILYKEDDYTFIGSHKEPYGVLSKMAGKKDGTIPTNFVFSPYLHAAELDMAFLWVWKGGQKECKVYNLPCKVTFMGDKWGVNYDWVGYNAGNKDQQQKNPSHWTQYDGDDKIFNEE